MIIVIGATGYIGRYFCTAMAEKGVDVLALGRSKKVQHFFEENKVPFQYFDVSDPHCFDQLPTEGVEAIVNLSACLPEHEVPVENFFTVNTLGVYRTLEFARQHDIKKVVVTSSHKVYYGTFRPVFSETDPTSFAGDHSPYIISKIAAENFVEYYNRERGMNAVVLRLTGVHGYGETQGYLAADGAYTKSTSELFFEKALKGEDIEVWGDQTIKRDHVYIKDVVSALWAAVNSGDARGIYNISGGIAHSQYEEALAIAKVFAGEKGKSKVICRPEKQGLVRGYLYDISKAKRELKWEPKFVDLVDMYEDYKKEWLRKKYHNYHHYGEGQAPLTV